MNSNGSSGDVGKEEAWVLVWGWYVEFAADFNFSSVVSLDIVVLNYQ